MFNFLEYLGPMLLCYSCNPTWSLFVIIEDIYKQFSEYLFKFLHMLLLTGGIIWV